jgi:Na+-driven multidrug efflux pump
MRTRWPWISMLLSIIIIVSPLGIGVLRDAFFTGELLSRSIAQPIVFIGLAILISICVIEWLVRSIISKRRSGGATTS